MLTIKDISKGFADVQALEQVSLNLEQGSIYGLVGSNGAGKTTLLKLLTGIYQPDAGEILFQGHQVYENVDVKAKICFIPDDLYFFGQYSVRNMADFYRTVYPNWNEERFLKLQQVFGLDMHKGLNRLSKGMRRQAAFWLAFSTMPELLVLDEPLDGLDPVMRQKVKNLLVQEVAERGTSVIISSHNLRDLEDLCDRVGILHRGSLILEKGMQDLISTVHKVQVAFSDGVPEAVLKHPGLVFKEERGSVLLLILRGDRQQITSELAQYNPVILDILPLTLEEIFIYEMGDAGYEIRNIVF